MMTFLPFKILLVLLLRPVVVSSSSVKGEDSVSYGRHRCATYSASPSSSSPSPSPSRPSCLIFPPPLCGTGNPIDDCWRCDPMWHTNRKKLADCAIGFGKNATGGKYGSFYTVTDSSDDPVNPKPGTLRHAAIQNVPLWIIFSRNMTITLQDALLVSSFKTIDGRGVEVRITGAGCVVLQDVTNVIVHGLHIYECVKTVATVVRNSPSSVVLGSFSDGDGVSIYASSNVWVDHNTLSNCTDGLVDATHVSTNVTISNNRMTNHDKVMLLGHSDNFPDDVSIQITVTLNHFGEGLVQRMPRCRFGNFHVVNNDYEPWGLYAVGGSSNPTINCQGNRFRAANITNRKELTRRENANQSEWSTWNWRFQDNILENNAFYVSSGSINQSCYEKATSLVPMPSSLVGAMTRDAGALNCKEGRRC